MADKISSPRRSKDRTRRRPSTGVALPCAGQHQESPHDRIRLLCALCLLLIGLNGCGLSGGSVPIGNGPKTTLEGTVILPDGQPAVGGTVAVRTLPTFQVVQTSATGPKGDFTASAVPSGSDLEVVVSTVDGATLKAIVPHDQLAANPASKPLNIGAVSAFSTVTAASIELEIAAQPMDTAAIIASQFTQLAQDVLPSGGSGGSEGAGDLGQDITNSAILQQDARTNIVNTANVEIANLSSPGGAAAASVALDGLLGYLNAAHGRAIVFTPTQKARLITAQVQGLTYTPDRVARALQAAGSLNANAISVQAGSKAERIHLFAFGNFGATITPFEALLIATDSGDAGGFQLPPKSLNIFLQHLLGK